MNRAVELVACVKLQPGLSREDFHHAARFWFRDAGGQLQPGTGAIEHEIMIVALAVG